MKVVRCENRHYYDADTYAECPHCADGMPPLEEDEMSYAIRPHHKGNSNEKGVSGKALDNDNAKTEVIDDSKTEIIEDSKTEILDDGKTELL